MLAWIAAGRRQADIAATLGVSERTAENHLRRARRRLGVATTAQAIKVAIRNGDIGPEPVARLWHGYETDSAGSAACA